MSSAAAVDATRVPVSAVERLVRNVENFRLTVQEAVATAPAAAAADANRWSRVQHLLERELAHLQREQEAFTAGEPESLLRHASELRMLARRMDGYTTGFSGDAMEQRLLNERQLIVLVAWQIHAAAHGSESAGL